MKNLLALVAVLFLALAACNEPEDEGCEACKKASDLVQRGKVEIGAGNFSDGAELCDSALEIDAASTDARYCIVVGRLGRLSLAINGVFNQIGSRLPGGDEIEYSPSIDLQPIIRGIIRDSEEEIAAIDEQLYALAGVENLQFQIPLVPIHLKFRKIAQFINSFAFTADGYQLPGEIIFDAGGTWDRSEIVAIGAAFNAVLGILDYTLAHDLNLSRIPASDNLFELFAELFLINPDLLRFSAKEETRLRLEGGVGEKGFSNDVIAFLSYVSGRDADLENAAPANPGLKGAIIESAALAATDAVVTWIDDDGDGHPEAVESRIFGDISEQLAGVRIDFIPAILSPDTMDALYALSAALLNNIEQDDEPASPQALLDGIRSDIGGFLSIDSLGSKQVPDFVALAPGAFLTAPLPVRKMLPLLYEQKNSYGRTTYGMLFDWEFKSYNSAQNWYFDFDANGRRISSSLGHFAALPDDAFQEFTPLSGVELTDDGVGPNSSVTSLLYVGLQSPSFGGLIHVDPSALGGVAGMGEASSQTINETMARLVKYYCFDFGFDEYSRYVFPQFKESCPDGSENQ